MTDRKCVGMRWKRSGTAGEAVSYTHLDVYKRQVIDCEASVSVSTTVSSNWVGAFAGYVQSFRAESCVYDAQKAAGWKTVGFVYNTSADDQQDIQAV